MAAGLMEYHANHHKVASPIMKALIMLTTITPVQGRYREPQELWQMVLPIVITAAIFFILIGILLYFLWSQKKLKIMRCLCCRKMCKTHNVLDDPNQNEDMANKYLTNSHKTNNVSRKGNCARHEDVNYSVGCQCEPGTICGTDNVKVTWIKEKDIVPCDKCKCSVLKKNSMVSIETQGSFRLMSTIQEEDDKCLKCKCHDQQKEDG